MPRNAYLLLSLATLFWAGNVVAGKLAVGHVSPMLLTAARWTIAFVLLAFIGRQRFRADWPAVRPRLPYLLAMGCFGFVVYSVAIYQGLVYTSAINASVEQAGMPMFIFLLNFLLFRLRVTVLQIAGFFLSLAGVLLTATHGDTARLLRLDVNVGDALVLSAVILYAGYTVTLRFKPQVHWQSLMIALTGSAFLTSLPFVLWEHRAGGLVWPDPQGWAIIGYVAIFPTILSQIYYIRGVELIGANRAGLFINLMPIFGTLLSIAVVGEALHVYHVAAMVLTLGGIGIAEYSGRRHQENTKTGP